jgi:DNA-binding NarL/FixJ family response regulator
LSFPLEAHAMPGRLVLLDDAPSTAEGFIRLAERHGLESFAATEPGQFVQLATRLRPLMVALNCDFPGADPVDLLARLAAAGSAARLILFGAEPRMLSLCRQAALALGYADPQVLDAPIEFRGLDLSAHKPAIALAG